MFTQHHVGRHRAAVIIPLLCSVAAAAAVNVGDRPRLDLKAMDGRAIRSADLDGRLVVLEFWATWCGPCVRMVPHLKALNAAWREKGVVLISVSQDRDAATARRFIRAHGMDWLHVHEGSQRGSLGAAFGVRGIPHAFVISPDGEVLWSGHPGGIDKPMAGFLESHPPRPSAGEQSAARQAAAVQALVAARNALRGDEPDFEAMLRHVGSIPPEALADRGVRRGVRRLAVRLRHIKGHEAALDEARAADGEAARRLDALLSAGRRAEKTGAEEEGAGSAAAARVAATDPRRLAARLRRAQAAAAAGRHAQAFRYYQWLLDHAPDSDAAATAATRLDAYEADESVMADIRRERDERQARSLLSVALSYEAADRPAEALKLYERIVAEYPDAACGAKARIASKRLAAADGRGRH